MLRKLTRAGELPKVAKQLQKVGCTFLSKKRLHVVCSLKAPLPIKNLNTCCHYNRRFKSSSFFGLFQSSAIAGAQKSNNYATEATVQVQRVSAKMKIRKLLRRLHKFFFKDFLKILKRIFM